jgi:hypothetical protein
MIFKVMGAAFDKDLYNCKIDGVIISGGLLKVGAQFLPPFPVVKVLVWLAQYYPKIVMPGTDFESTFDDAFGDKDWRRRLVRILRLLWNNQGNGRSCCDHIGNRYHAWC